MGVYMQYINEIEKFLGLDNSELHSDYVCMLAGQVSSGKSKFMNYLMGKDLLPVGTRELTAVPTYIKSGTSEALIYSGDISRQVDIEDIKNFRKGACDCEEIKVTLDCMKTPEDLVFVDTPGTNTISFDKSEEVTKKADAILYFLVKGLTATDVTSIDEMCRNRNIKLVFVRTRIDDIKISEENIMEIYQDERAIIKSLFPSADFFFVSLTNAENELNQLSMLMSYVKYDLKTELVGMREEYIKDYALKVLCPALEKMKLEVIEKGANKEVHQLLEKSKMQLSEIHKNLNDYEPQIRSFAEQARDNYVRNGSMYINRIIESIGFISVNEIQMYALDCIKKFEEWYRLEFEDAVSNINATEKPGERKELLSKDVIDKVFVMYDKQKKRFVELSVFEQEGGLASDDCFEEASEANKYLEKIFKSIFFRIDAEISDNFTERANNIIDDLSKQFEREDRLVQLYSGNESETVNRIEKYLTELKKYGSSEEGA